jgi:Zn ribbon nucleic-acid-binding protein
VIRTTLNEAVANLKENFESAVPNCQKCAIKELWEATEKEDLVSVVRCKDCRYAMVRTEEEMNKPIKPQPILCEWFCIGVENDDYCSHGERRK